jgi:hypothetical protein
VAFEAVLDEQRTDFVLEEVVAGGGVGGAGTERGQCEKDCGEANHAESVQ